MSTELIEQLYEVTGDMQVFSGYFILLFFLLRKDRILTRPYNLYFINLVIYMAFDHIAMYLHYTGIMPSYFKFITPFYFINNIVFLGLFFTFYAKNNIKKFFAITICLTSALMLLIYFNGSFQELYPWGYLLELIIMTAFVLVGIRYALIQNIKLSNRKPYLIIGLCLLVAFLTSMAISVFYQRMQQISSNFLLLFYGLSNIVWIIYSLLSAYAISTVVPNKKIHSGH